MLIANAILAQDTVYFDQQGNKLKSAAHMDYYAVITKNVLDTNQLSVKEYSYSGQILSDEFYISYKEHSLHGVQKTWYKNGAIRSEINYEQGKKNGLVLTYWENGRAKRKDIFKNGKFKKGTCWDELGNSITHFDYVIMPEFPGGKRNFYQYLSDNVGYPLKSYNQKVEGKVIIRFTVEKDGSITNVHVFKGINEELNWEAMRVVKFMPKWTPGKIDGELARMRYSIPISFVINH